MFTQNASQMSQLDRRRESVFLLLAGLFVGSMAMLNILGITRFIQLGPLTVAVGVLPYPLTFICTDLISEFYGRRRATTVVWAGLAVNILVISFVWLGNNIPAVAPALQPPWQTLDLASSVALPDGSQVSGKTELFQIIYGTTAGAVLASMIAYLAAQFCDVFLFHFWKKLTNGRHLWLRNNGSTVVSQLVDSVMVIGITFGAAHLRGEISLSQMGNILLGNYSFKLLAALVDTIPIYIAVYYLSRYLKLDPKNT